MALEQVGFLEVKPYYYTLAVDSANCEVGPTLARSNGTARTIPNSDGTELGRRRKGAVGPRRMDLTLANSLF